MNLTEKLNNISDKQADVEATLTQKLDNIHQTQKDVKENLTEQLGDIDQQQQEIAANITDEMRDLHQNHTDLLREKVEDLEERLQVLQDGSAVTNILVRSIDSSVRATQSSCSLSDARNVMIIQGPNASTSKTYDLFTSVVALRAGIVTYKLLGSVEQADFEGLSTVIVAPQEDDEGLPQGTVDPGQLQLVADWYNYNKCGVLVILAEFAPTAASGFSVDTANAILQRLHPKTPIRVGSTVLGPSACANDVIETFTDPFFFDPVTQIASTSAFEVTGGGRALLKINGNTLARLGNTNRLVVIGDDDFLNDVCQSAWSETGNTAFVNNLLDLAGNLLPPLPVESVAPPTAPQVGTSNTSNTTS
mmetsp:Transcript_26282/g.49365  ORF Transcript_26282/g.49365 Transcript_26282/m.49365 type:complete len:362 (-) Transcript_26282:200-1285(-)